MKQLCFSLIAALFIFAGKLNAQNTIYPNPGSSTGAYTVGGIKQIPAEIYDGNGSLGTTYTATACGLNFVQVSKPLYARPFNINFASPQPATYTVTGLPTCCVILKAFFYAGTSGNGIATTVTITNPQNNTTAFPMTLIGSHIDKCWGYGGSHTYRADVTSIVTGNGNYVISGIPTGNPNDADGGTLFIIYQDLAQNYTGSIVMADGASTAPSGTRTHTLTGFQVCGPVANTTNFMLVGDLQGLTTTSISLNSPTPNFIKAANTDQVWDFISSANAPATPGQNSAPFAITNPNDCYNLVLCGMYYQTSCLTCTLAPGNFSINVATSPTCGAGSATVTPVGAPGPFTYSWTNLPQTTSVVTNVPPGTYTVYVTNLVGCSQASAVVNIQASALYPINVNSVTICESTSATLIATGGAPDYTWTPAGNLNTNTGSVVIASPPATTIYTIIATNSLGCVSTKTTVVNVIPVPSMTVINLTGSYSITCINPTINLAATTNYTYGTLGYTWTSISFTANTTTVGITQPGSFVVTGSDPQTGCSVQSTVAVNINTVIPTTTVNPASQVITCNSGAPVTFSGTVTNPTVNIQHDWYSPLNPLPGGVPIATSNNTLTILSGNVPPGVYTLQTTILTNGCKAFKTVTVTSLSSFPTFSMSSPTNFSVGCAPLNQTTLSIINPVSTQTPPSTCSFTFLAPSFTGVVTPSVVLDPNNSSTITNIPGTWTVIVQDNSNFCRTEITVPVLQNTFAPNVGATIPGYTLMCRTQTLLATGTSSTPNTVISWIVPSTPPNLSTPTVAVGDIANGPQTSTTSLTYANFTVVATNSLNACISTSVITISQNFRPPVSSPQISIATPTAIYCNAATAPVVLTTGNSTTTSGGGPTAFVANPCWSGPSPQTSTCGASSYSAYVPGIYSLTVEDNYNGCKRTGTVNVVDRTQPPVLNNPTDTEPLDCGSSKADLVASINGPTQGIKYYYFYYPPGTSFSPTNAITPFVTNPNLSGTNSPSVSVDKVGLYFYLVTNTITGCKTTGTFEVKGGDLVAAFEPNVVEGYAPLEVSFNNNSASSNGSSSITSVWNFGNGTSQTNQQNQSTSATYAAAGTYTVMLLTKKGDCLDTAYKIIKVDIPSNLEIPNIFSPNGDGSNDLFFLKAANLSEINMTVFDRWGAKVYDVNSTTGNIAWDGKNLNGKDCAAGVYMYVLKAKGKDEQTYERKGNITLVR